MAGIQASDQSPIITQAYLNTAAYTGDPGAGVTVATSSVSGSIVQEYGGQVGGVLTLGPGGAGKLSDPGAYTLYGGNYQYLQVKTTASGNCAQGQVVFWSDIVNGIVTPDAPSAATVAFWAGIALANTAKGNYWFFQTGGVASIKFVASITKTTPVAGDQVYIDGTPGIYADVLADATNVTSPILKRALGVAWASAPANSTISPVLLRAAGGPLPTGAN